MLRITPSRSSSGAKHYFAAGLTRSDYYLQDQEVAGLWGGKGAALLGLHGPVSEREYFALCDNLHPQTSEQLTPRNKENRRVMYDWTFSAPKPVSVLFELSRDERILHAFQASFRETLLEAEREMKTRVRAGGKNEDRLTENSVHAEFLHFTARPVKGHPSPHLHAHCCVFNVTFDAVENRWKASQQGDLKRDADYWEAAFHARFAKRLNAMGIATVKQGTSFTLAGVPQSVTDKFSERRNVIERKAAERGIFDAKGKHSIGYFGREHKTLDREKAELRAEWDAKLTEQERDALRASSEGRTQRDREITPEAAIAHSLDHSFERVSALSEKRIMAEALRYGVGSILPEQVGGLGERDGITTVEVSGQRMMTTKAMLAAEISILKFSRDGHGRFAPYVKGDVALPGLSKEQHSAAMHVLHSRDRVTGIKGGAGTGKTRMMASTIAAIEGTADTPETPRRKVFVFAPSAQASRGVLRGEGFANAETLERLLVDEKLQTRTRGQVLWVDEAGMLSTRSMQRLFDVARAQECRVILSGDYRQHASVEAGDGLRLLESQAGVRLASLTKIRRQKDPAYRKAVEEIARGTPSSTMKGFDDLDQQGAIIEVPGEERHPRLAADYLEAVSEGKSVLIIAPTHSEGGRLTETVRQALKEQGFLGKEREFAVRRPTHWTQAQKEDARNFEPGMIVEFHQATPGLRRRVNGERETTGGYARGARAVVVRDGDAVWLQREDGTRGALPAGHGSRFQVYTTGTLSVAAGDRISLTKNGRGRMEESGKEARVNNGESFTVEGFTRAGDIRLSGGKVLPRDYGHFDFGYVDTSYAAQGKTVDRVIIAAGNESLPATGQQQWYVSVSRGRESCRVYVESKDDVRDAIARKGERLSAVELVLQREPDAPSRREALIERNRIWRFMKERAAAIANAVRARLFKDAPEQGGLSYGRG